jgi:hypothetical protein
MRAKPSIPKGCARRLRIRYETRKTEGFSWPIEGPRANAREAKHPEGMRPAFEGLLIKRHLLPQVF